MAGTRRVHAGHQAVSTAPEGGSRADAAVPGACRDPLPSPHALCSPSPPQDAAQDLHGKDRGERAEIQHPGAAGHWGLRGAGKILSPFLAGARVGCRHPRRCGHPGPSLLGCGSGPRARTSPALGCLQAYEGVLQLVEARGQYEELCIIMCVIPATISNNVPGTDFSLGSDTAVNAAMEVRDRAGGSSRGRPAPPCFGMTRGNEPASRPGQQRWVFLV